MKILIIRAEYGEIKEKKVVEGEPAKVLKEVVAKALEMWNPSQSDLVVVRHTHEVRVKLPLSKEQYQLYSRYNLRKVGSDMAAFDVPLYVVSYENRWVGEDLVDSRVFIVAPYLDDNVASTIEELAKSITSGGGETEELEEE